MIWQMKSWWTPWCPWWCGYSHQHWGGEPHNELARWVVQTRGLFQGQNCTKQERLNLNMHDVSIYMARTVVCTEHSHCVLFGFDGSGVIDHYVSETSEAKSSISLAISEISITYILIVKDKCDKTEVLIHNAMLQTSVIKGWYVSKRYVTQRYITK